MLSGMPGVTSVPEIKKEIRDQKVPLYNVVLLDDDQHTYEYVVEMLEKLFACGETDAWNAYGADWRMPNSKGSMSAVVEPASFSL
jgi:ATP-dependent Clp protease adaptor protein ClpS